MSRAAWTIAQAIRWVKLSLRPASLSSRRRASSTSTWSVRKLVAVGIERLSSMKRASVAAGPRIGCDLGAARRARLPSPSERGQHVLLGDPPARAAALDGARGRAPWALAMRAATGVALAAPLPAGAGRRGRRRPARRLAGAVRRARPPRPRSGRAPCRRRPSSRARPGSRRRARRRARAGRRRPCRSRSRRAGRRPRPGRRPARRHSSTVPSATESPISGNGDVDELGLGGARRLSGSRSGAAAGAAPLPPTSISPSTAPTCTVRRARRGSWSACPRRGPAPRRRPCRWRPRRAARRPRRGRRPA